MKKLDININDFPVKERKLCDREYFRWQHDYPFVHIICTTEGILLEGTHGYSTGNDGGIVVRKNHGRVLLPKAIRNAYSITEESRFKVAKLKENQWLIVASPVSEPAMPMSQRKNIRFNSKNAVKEGYAVMKQRYVAIPHVEKVIPFNRAKVTLHLRDCLRIDIQQEKDARYSLSLDELKDYYGKHLQGFAGDTVTFSVELHREKHIPFPQVFLEKVKVPHGTMLELYKSTDDKGRVMYSIAPADIQDMITGKSIDLKMEMPEPAVICEECSENIGNIRIIANEFLKLAQTFQEFAMKYDTITSENEKIMEENAVLREKLEAAENKNAMIMELLKK